MRAEIQQLHGQLALAKKKYSDLEKDAAGLIQLVRLYTSPYEPDVTKLEIPKAAAAMRRLEDVHREMTALKTSIAGMESDLNV
jgi:hypothetical protein